MILLPRGNPIKEKIDPGKVNLPEAMNKLRAGGFTGYLRFDAGAGTGVVIFEQGRLISALFQADHQRLVAYEAIARAFQESLRGGVNLDIYRLSPELAMSIHALLHGDVLYQGQELKLLDIKALLAQLREDRINGCLRIYTAQRVALIFYRDGNPVGFFHDGSTEIETTADTSMSVARLPGAKVDVLTTSGSGEPRLADLMASADFAMLWEKAKRTVAESRKREDAAVNQNREMQSKELREKVLVFLRKTAERHIGKIGASLVDKELPKAAGNGPLSEEVLTSFYAGMVKAGKLVAGPSAVNAMIGEMQQGVKSLIK